MGYTVSKSAIKCYAQYVHKCNTFAFLYIVDHLLLIFLDHFQLDLACRVLMVHATWPFAFILEMRGLYSSYYTNSKSY